MKQVLIFTNFKDYLKSFSPLILAGQQIKMLHRAGYKPKVIATEGFAPPKGSPYNLAEIRYIPDVPRDAEDSKNDPKFQEDVENLKKVISKHLKDIDVVITHDLLFLPDYTKYNIACRSIAKESKIKWLHWIHSATSPNILINERKIYADVYTEVMGQPFPNSIIVYPNSYDTPRVAKSFGFDEENVKSVPHWLDYEEYMKFEPETIELIEKHNLLDAEVICVYPLRMDRGKQPHINMEIMAEVKRAGASVRMIFMDFQSTGGDKVTYRDEIKAKAATLGLNDQDLVFTSDTEKLNLECPQKMVSDMLQLSNIFILPSKSETYSLVAQEALSKGNFLILNHDFPAMRSIYGEDKSIYYKFSSGVDIMRNIAESGEGETTTKHNPTETAFYAEIAKRLLYEIRNNRVLQGKTWVRKERNLIKVFKTHIEPLIYKE